MYVASWARGRGVGQRALRFLDAADPDFPENTASLALHARCGFRAVGRLERLGCHHGRWRDVILLERRSDRVGY